MFPADKPLDRDGFSQQEVAKAAHVIKLTAYNGTTIPCCGTWSFPSKFQQSMWEDTEFHIVNVQGPAVIGLPSSECLKIVTLHCSITTDPDQGTTNKLVPTTSIQDLMRTYPDQFDRIGSLPEEPPSRRPPLEDTAFSGCPFGLSVSVPGHFPTQDGPDLGAGRWDSRPVSIADGVAVYGAMDG